MWSTWTEEKGYSPDIVNCEVKELDEKLQKFLAKVRKKAGSDYEPDSLRVIIITPLDSHLKVAGSSISIIVKYSKRKLASSVNRATANVTEH